MKSLYWKSSYIPVAALIIIAIIAMGGVFAVENFRLRIKQPYYEEKYQATLLAKDAFAFVRDTRRKMKIPVDTDVDPTDSGLIGRLSTEITSSRGLLQSKQASVNPNFAGLVVHYLKKIGVKKGDVVALGISGSFPAVNIATYSALRTLEVKPIIISSASASQWGANIPGFSWLDIESKLYEKKLFPFRSVAASLGGIADKAIGISDKGRQILVDTIAKHQIPLIEGNNLEENVQQRIDIYRREANSKPIKAYINIGGARASTGSKYAKLSPGINDDISFIDNDEKSISNYFAEEHIPVINMTEIRSLADTFGFQKVFTEQPPVGQGKIYSSDEYNRVLAFVFIVLIIVSLLTFVRSNLVISIKK